MLPSKDKFHLYVCPYFLAGNCDRPYCHFKHSETPDTNQSPTQEVEDCPSSCTCQNQPANFIYENSESTNKVPQYRPTPISLLQKRTAQVLDDPIYSKVAVESDAYSPLAGSKSTVTALTYKPSTITELVNEEYNPPNISQTTLQKYDPSVVKILEPKYSPGGAVLNNHLNYEPSVKTLKQESKEYTPSASRNSKTKLTYSPTCDSKQKKIKLDLEYDPYKYKSVKPELPDIVDSNAESKMSQHYSDLSPELGTPEVSNDNGKSSVSGTDDVVRVPTNTLPSSSNCDIKKSKSKSSRSHEKQSKSRAHESSSKNRKSEKKENKKESETKHDKSSSKSSKHKSRKVEDERKKSSENDNNQRSSSRRRSKDRHHSSHKKSSSKDRDKSHHSSHHSSKSSKHSSSKKKSSSKTSKESHSKTKLPDTREDEFELNTDTIESHFDVENSSEDELQECLKIFEEFEFDGLPLPIESEIAKLPLDSNKPDASTTAEEDYVIQGKRRVAHFKAAAEKPKVKNVIRPVPASAGQMLAERWRKQQRELQKQKEAKETAAGVDRLLSQLVDDEPKPSVPNLEKKKEAEPEPKAATTSAQSFGKGKKRVEHKPKKETLPRPVVNAQPGDRIPCGRRQHCLDKFVIACLEIYGDQEVAFEKAIELEKLCFSRSLIVTVYNNMFVNQLLKLKRGDVDTASSSSSSTAVPSSTQGLSHDKYQISFEHGVIKKTTVMHRNYDFRGSELYQRLIRYKLTYEQLKELSFPLAPNSLDDVGRVELHNVPKHKQIIFSPENPERECTRCLKPYTVDPFGMPEEDECIFHARNAYAKRVKGTIEHYYACCDRRFPCDGCERNKYHICDKIDITKLAGFVKTLEKDIPEIHSGVYALDCEMCITTHGTELTRVTVLNDANAVIYDTLVKPDKPVLDYLTRFSGVTEDMLKNVTCTLRDVQGVLLNLFNSNTILIGHSLNSDLLVLKLIHECVVDTSIVFPHRDGLPKRRALRNLAKDHLLRLIQQEESGHCSKEDAEACLDLMKYKVREDAKLE